MSTEISPENEQFIQEQLAAGAFRSRTDAIDAGLELLRRRNQLLDRIDIGRRQLVEGECTDYDDRELEERFDQLRISKRSDTCENLNG